MPTSTISRCGGAGGGGFQIALLESSPNALWKLNEASGTTAFDSLSGHHDAFLTGVAPTWQAVLAPTGDYCPLFPDNGGFTTSLATYAPDLSGDFSVAAFVRTVDLQICTFVGQDNPEQAHSGWMLWAQTGANTPGNRLAGDVGNGSAGAWYYSNAARLAGQWYWLVSTHSGSTWTLYVNGVAQTVTYSGVYSAASNHRIWIGTPGGSFGQLGTFYESWVTLWATRALSAAEIAALWAAA